MCFLQGPVQCDCFERTEEEEDVECSELRPFSIAPLLHKRGAEVGGGCCPGGAQHPDTLHVGAARKEGAGGADRAPLPEGSVGVWEGKGGERAEKLPQLRS
ncbi:hypothetical protein Anapl_17033 [Anas platyrhynchos]|uniref:Uncharacterized protein n=1 Tax=Anas platyrhynchos TaxID=8839 RepID=R0JPP9_ANAPL|nr:hypothetical protein Anapl_17033 [Anas platyrhynchos]